MHGRTVLLRGFVMLVLGLVTLLPGRLRGQPAPQVDVALVLAIDCSWSVNPGEFALQAGGMAAAFRDPVLIALIQRGRAKRIAVTVVQWAGTRQQAVVIPWGVVANSGDATALAARIEQMPRLVADGPTSMTALMRYAAVLIEDGPFTAHRAVIDIASDGRNNSGGDPRPVRDLLGAVGITINGLAILTEVATLHHYFRRTIIAGPGNFVEIANGYNDFSRAMRKKLFREISKPGIT